MLSVKDVYKFSWLPSFMDESSEQKKRVSNFILIFENWSVYSPLSALFDIVSSFVAGELADWSVYLFLVTPHFVHSETSVFKAYLEGQTTDIFVLKVWKFKHNIYPESNSVLCFYRGKIVFNVVLLSCWVLLLS